MGKYKKESKAYKRSENPFFSFQPHYKKFDIVDSVHDLRKLAKRMNELEEFAFDTETNTLKVNGPNSKFNLVCITISWGEYNNYYIPIGHLREEDFNRNLDIDDVVKYLGPIFAKPDIRLIGQNIKYDMHVLERVGIHTTTTDIWDTMILSWLCDENTPNGLKENSAMKMGLDQTHFKEVTESVPNAVKKEFGLKANAKATYDLVLIDDGAPYALDDSYLTWELYLGFIQLVSKEHMYNVYKRSYRPFIRTLFLMEERGVVVDKKRLKEMQKEIHKDIDDLLYKMYEIAGVEFNAGSNQQLAELFFAYQPEIKDPRQDKPKWHSLDEKKQKAAMSAYYKKLEAQEKSPLMAASFGFRVIDRTKNGAPATSGDVFWKISRMSFKNKHKKDGVALASLLVDYKKLAKLCDAFIDGMPDQLYDDGKVHPNFNIIGADSGRISCVAENTPIKCVGGDKPIQEVKVGDLVYCYDDSGVPHIRKVLNVMDKGVRPCVSVNYRSQGTHDSGSLVCTPEHKILSGDLQWVRADSLASNDQIVHLRRSKDERPRLYGYHGFCEQEQLIIKHEVFHCYSHAKVIHHKDLKKGNNELSNLQIMWKRQHTSYHANLLLEQGKLDTYTFCHSSRPDVKTGTDNPRYVHYSAEQLENMIRRANGRIKNIPMDFNTFKKKCADVGFDYRKVAGEYQTQYRDVSDSAFAKAFFECKGVPYAIATKLNIGRTKVCNTIKRLDLCYNHRVVSVAPVGDRHVYDLEVEEFHNFIASEICVHNCSNPNLQQLPKADEEDKYKIRSLFIGSIDPVTKKRKKIIAVDFSNLEMRVLAHFSEDKKLLQMFASGADTHGYTAVNMFGLDCDPSEVKKKYPHLRQAAKVLNFLLMYGGSALRLYEQLRNDHNNPVDLGSPEYLREYHCRDGVEVAQIFVDKYFDTYSGVAKFIRSQKKFAHKYGYVETLLQRKRRLPDINSSDGKMRSYCERLAVNAPVQGSAADMTSNAQNRVEVEGGDWFRKRRAQMILQVHDELVFECPEEFVEEVIIMIQAYMSHPFGDNVELNLAMKADADSGDSYQDAK